MHHDDARRRALPLIKMASRIVALMRISLAKAIAGAEQAGISAH